MTTITIPQIFTKMEKDLAFLEEMEGNKYICISRLIHNLSYIKSHYPIDVPHSEDIVITPTREDGDIYHNINLTLVETTVNKDGVKTERKIELDI